jgi:hypothetical protein
VTSPFDSTGNLSNIFTEDEKNKVASNGQTYTGIFDFKLWPPSSSNPSKCRGLAPWRRGLQSGSPVPPAAYPQINVDNISNEASSVKNASS